MRVNQFIPCTVASGGGGGTGRREPGRIEGRRGTGDERAGSGSSKRAGSRRKMRNAIFLSSTMR